MPQIYKELTTILPWNAFSTVYIFYNHVRPHSFNNDLTPFQKGLL